MKPHTIIIVLVLCSAYAHAQTPAQTPELNKELRAKAFNLLESAAGEVSVLQSAENRARIAANIMESLWTHDEKRARSLLVFIENDIKQALNSDDPLKPKDPHRFQVFLKLRADTIDRIAKYDPELALAFLKSTELTTQQRLPNHLAEYNRNLELRLAKKIGANNPEMALKIARESLRRGLSDDLLMVLRQLNKKHKEHAATLYKEIVSKVKDVNLQNHWQNKNFVQRLTLSFTPPEADAATFQELLSLLLTKAMDAGCRKREREHHDLVYFCRWIVSSIPPAYRADGRVAELSHWASHERTMPDGYYELDIVAENGSVDEVLKLRDKYPQFQDNINGRAFELAVSAGDLAKARDIAKSTTNAELQKAMIERLDADGENAKAFNEKLMSDLQRGLNEQLRPEERLMMLISVADRIAATDRDTALKLLNQASEVADTLQPAWQQAEAQMGIAMMYCRSKSDRCFQVMGMLVPKLNQLVDAAARLDGFETQYLRDGEWNMSANGRVGQLLTTLADHAGYFAWSDFDRAVSLSSQFERIEIRLMAQVKLAQSALAGPPPSLFERYAGRYRY